MRDLRERYATEVDGIHASAPIIPFMETIVPPPVLDRVNESIQQQADTKLPTDAEEMVRVERL